MTGNFRAAPPMLFLLVSLGAGRQALSAQTQSVEEASSRYQREILPIFQIRCVSCHGAEKPKGGLRLDMVNGVAAGDSGPAWVAGDPAGSLLLQLVKGGNPDYPPMPPKGERLTSEQIASIEKWIAEGAGAASAPVTPPSPAPANAPDPHTKMAANQDDALWASLVPREAPVDFAREIFPVLESHCLACHGPEKQKAQLRLDSSAAALQGGVSGTATTPGDAKASLIVRRILGAGGDEQMPPGDRAKLTPDQINAVAGWIQQGAVWPDGVGASESAVQRHWAFVKPERPAPPEVKDSSWPRNPIDRFILAKLEANGMAPSPPAPKATLLRRAALDLTGIPPTAEEVAEFEANSAADAFTRRIDTLLASPHYGERWARHWLDGARYADSNGYSIDGPRSIWPYRDWVIRAFNDNKPYAQFVIEQLAGDLLPRPTQDQIIATGFHRNTMINQEGGVDPEEFRIEAVVDRVNTTGTVFLGLTIECAHCHNHKYDPITQRDYYRLFAFFDSDDEPEIEIGDAAAIAESAAAKAQRAQLDRELETYRARQFARWKSDSLTSEEFNLLPESARELISTPADKRGEDFDKRLAKAFDEHDPGYLQRRKVITDLRRKEKNFPTTMALGRRADPRQTRIHLQGDFTRPGDPVKPGAPAALGLPLSISGEGPPTRLDLARWIVHRDNPLTARVMVNRVWARYFGRGLVETDNDFGTMGSPPTHPELLDWLAVEFMESGWDLKHLHRLILESATYQQSSMVSPEAKRTDPENQWLGRQPRLRLDAEIIRDVGLSVSGLLNPAVGGPPVHPPQPDGVMKLGQVARDWKVSKGEDRHRRGLYTYFWRGTPHPSLIVFDAPNAVSACTRRVRSNTPLQALTLLNDEAFHEIANALGDRIAARPEADEASKLRWAFRACLAREPDEVELETLLKTLNDARAKAAAPLTLDKLFAKKEGPEPAESGQNEKKGAPTPWQAAARVLINLDEFITRE